MLQAASSSRDGRHASERRPRPDPLAARPTTTIDWLRLDDASPGSRRALGRFLSSGRRSGHLHTQTQPVSFGSKRGRDKDFFIILGRLRTAAACLCGGVPVSVKRVESARTSRVELVRVRASAPRRHRAHSPASCSRSTVSHVNTLAARQPPRCRRRGTSRSSTSAPRQLPPTLTTLESDENVVLQAKDFGDIDLLPWPTDKDKDEEDMRTTTAMRTSPTTRSRPGASRPTKFRGRSRRRVRLWHACLQRPRR